MVNPRERPTPLGRSNRYSEPCRSQVLNAENLFRADTPSVQVLWVKGAIGLIVVLTDEELIERYRDARASAAGESFLNQLFERHHARVAAWCHRITGDIDFAADLAQDVFLKAFQNIESFRGDCRFSTWLYSMARNRCMDELRSRASRPGETDGVILDQLADTRSEQVSQMLERRESVQSLRRLIQESLDETEAKVMTLHYVEELPLDSITRLLGLQNASGAKAYVVSARRKLERIAERKGTGPRTMESNNA
jgi:RNA polymerase sigma-70 factor, ECF subfamily